MHERAALEVAARVPRPAHHLTGRARGGPQHVHEPGGGRRPAAVHAEHDHAARRGPPRADRTRAPRPGRAGVAHAIPPAAGARRGPAAPTGPGRRRAGGGPSAARATPAGGSRALRRGSDRSSSTVDAVSRRTSAERGLRRGPARPASTPPPRPGRRAGRRRAPAGPSASCPTAVGRRRHQVLELQADHRQARRRRHARPGRSGATTPPCRGSGSRRGACTEATTAPGSRNTDTTTTRHRSPGATAGTSGRCGGPSTPRGSCRYTEAKASVSSGNSARGPLGVLPSRGEPGGEVPRAPEGGEDPVVARHEGPALPVAGGIVVLGEEVARRARHRRRGGSGSGSPPRCRCGACRARRHRAPATAPVGPTRRRRRDEPPCPSRRARARS